MPFTVDEIERAAEVERLIRDGVSPSDIMRIPQLRDFLLQLQLDMVASSQVAAEAIQTLGSAAWAATATFRTALQQQSQWMNEALLAEIEESVEEVTWRDRIKHLSFVGAIYHDIATRLGNLPVQVHVLGGGFSLRFHVTVRVNGSMESNDFPRDTPPSTKKEYDAFIEDILVWIYTNYLEDEEDDE